MPADFIISFTQTLSRGYETLGSFNKLNANPYIHIQHKILAMPVTTKPQLCAPVSATAEFALI